MGTKEINFWYWLVRWMPKKLVYFSFMSVMVHSTTGEYGDTLVTELTGVDAIKRYGDDKGIH